MGRRWKSAALLLSLVQGRAAEVFVVTVRVPTCPAYSSVIASYTDILPAYSTTSFISNVTSSLPSLSYETSSSASLPSSASTTTTPPSYGQSTPSLGLGSLLSSSSYTLSYASTISSSLSPSATTEVTTNITDTNGQVYNLHTNTGLSGVTLTYSQAAGGSRKRQWTTTASTNGTFEECLTACDATAACVAISYLGTTCMLYASVTGDMYLLNGNVAFNSERFTGFVGAAGVASSSSSSIPPMMSTVTSSILSVPVPSSSSISTAPFSSVSSGPPPASSSTSGIQGVSTTEAALSTSNTPSTSLTVPGVSTVPSAVISTPSSGSSAAVSSTSSSSFVSTPTTAPSSSSTLVSTSMIPSPLISSSTTSLSTATSAPGPPNFSSYLSSMEAVASNGYTVETSGSSAMVVPLFTSTSSTTSSIGISSSMTSSMISSSTMSSSSPIASSDSMVSSSSKGSSSFMSSSSSLSKPSSSRTSSSSSSTTTILSVTSSSSSSQSSSMSLPGSSSTLVSSSATSSTAQTIPMYSMSTTYSSSSSSAMPSATPVRNTGKRGLCYTNDSYTPLYSLSGQNSQVSWEYDYFYSRYTGNDSISNPALTFIPLLFNNAPDLLSVWPEYAQAAIDQGADALMSFNEPDGCYGGQACMTVNQSVSAYLQAMQPFAGKARLGAPAVTNGGPPSSLTYLSWFIGNCTGCTIDFINLHWYSNVYAFSYLQYYVETAYAEFGLPIWVTEFGIDSSGGTDAQYQAFLEQAIPWLDAVPYVERYAYFYDGPGYLINANGSGLSAQGVIYNSYTAPCPKWNNSAGTCT